MLQLIGFYGAVVTALGEYYRRHNITRFIHSFVSLMMILVLLAMLGIFKGSTVELLGREVLFDNLSAVIVLPLAILVTVIIAAVVSLVDWAKLKDHSDFEDAVVTGIKSLINQQIEQPRRQETASEKQEAANDFMELQLNLNQILEYYTINKGQAKSSFRASTTAITVGFGTIIVGVWLSFQAPAGNMNPAYISVLGGVMLQFVGGAYFYMYNRSLIQLNFFFSRLAAVQDSLMAIRLSETLPDGTARHRSVEKLLLLIASRNLKEPSYLTSPIGAPRSTRRTPIPNASVKANPADAGL